MFIPATCGRLRIAEGSCFLEHRSTNNHFMTTRLVLAISDEEVGTSPEEAALFLRERGLGDGDQVFIDGFLIGRDSDIALAVRGASAAPTHRGTLFKGSPSHLVKQTGTHELRRFGSAVLATQMLQQCPHQQPIELTGMEALSPSGIPIIDIDTIVSCGASVL